MKIARLSCFILAAAAILLQAGAAQAAMKTQWIDYKQGDTALSGYLVYDDAVQHHGSLAILARRIPDRQVQRIFPERRGGDQGQRDGELSHRVPISLHGSIETITASPSDRATWSPGALPRSACANSDS